MRDRLKALIRLLKVLNTAGFKGAEYDVGGEAVTVLGHGRSHRFERGIHDEALRRGLVAANDRLSLTAEGRAALARLLDPENGFQAQNSQLVARQVQQEGKSGPVLANHAESPLERLQFRKAGRGAAASVRAMMVRAPVSPMAPRLVSLVIVASPSWLGCR